MGDKSNLLGKGIDRDEGKPNCAMQSQMQVLRYSKKKLECHQELTKRRDCPLQG